MFMISFNDRLRGIKKNARFEQSDIESPLGVFTALSLQEMYTQFDLEVFDVMAECLSEDPSKRFTDILVNYKDNVLSPRLEKTLSALAGDAKVVSTHDDQNKQLSLAFVVPDDATFGTLMKAKRYLEEEMGIHKVSNMRFDFNCITVLFDIAYPAGDIEELSESFLSNKHLQEMKKLNIHDVFLLSHWAVGVTDGSICYFHEVPMQPDIVPLAGPGVIERKNPPIQMEDFQSKLFMGKYQEEFLEVVNAHAIRMKLQIDGVIPEGLSFEIGRTANDKAGEMLYLHLRDYATSNVIHKLCDAMTSKSGYPKMIKLGQKMKSDKDLPPYIKESKVPQQAKTSTDISPAPVAGVKRLYEATAKTTGPPDLPSRDTLEEFYKKTPTDPELLKVVEEFPVWHKIAISLGVPINQVEAFQMQHMGGVKALSYWKNGKSGKDYPSTWGFLLKVVEEKMGSKPAKDLLKLVRKV